MTWEEIEKSRNLVMGRESVECKLGKKGSSADTGGGKPYLISRFLWRLARKRQLRLANRALG
jgi:hypothetical protein